MNIQIAPIIKVSDIQKSLSFYCSVFGFSKQWEYAASADGPWYACLTWQGSELHLSSFPGDGPSGVAVYFHIDNVDDDHQDPDCNLVKCQCGKYGESEHLSPK